MNNDTVDIFFDFLKNVLHINITDAFNLIRIRLNGLRKNVSKNITAKILQTTHYDAKYEIYYHFVLDVIDTKLYKPKASPTKTVSSLLPDLPSEEKIPIVTYKLGGTIQNNILNYKDTVESIYVDNVSFTRNATPCECETSTFCDPHQKHIITADLRLIKNNKLRKLLTKSPNFREPSSFSKALKEVPNSLDECIDTLSKLTIKIG